MPFTSDDDRICIVLVMGSLACLRCMIWLLQITGALTAPTIHGTHVPVEEPSTASLSNSCAAKNGAADLREPAWLRRALRSDLLAHSLPVGRGGIGGAALGTDTYRAISW